jgi:hypothetical protein
MKKVTESKKINLEGFITELVDKDRPEERANKAINDIKEKRINKKRNLATF